MHYQPLFDRLEQYAVYGRQRYASGRVLLARAPHIAPEAWLIKYGGGIKDTEIHELEEETGITFPEDFKIFLRESNGLGLFHELYIYGKRYNYIRTVDESAWQPFSIVTPNTYERPADARPTYLFIGAYTEDGTQLYIDTETGKVHASARDTCKSVKEWPGFEDMIYAETRRLMEEFDEAVLSQPQMTSPSQSILQKLKNLFSRT